MADSVRTITGELTIGKHQKFAIIASRFNEFVCSRLVDGAIDALARHGCPPADITVIRVPGSWELPLAARKVAAGGEYAAVVCLGCVIRGETPHFDYVAAEAAKGIAQVGLSTNVPIVFGVVTADTLEQAINRAGAKAGNKGADAAMTAIEMANLYVKLDGKNG
jgi:6,7-dimethyl-8-ribityllumazine synthase